MDTALANDDLGLVVTTTGGSVWRFFARRGLDTDPLFGRTLLFVSNPVFDPGFAYECFCFEPMSHRVDAHHADDGGLRRLAPGERLQGSVSFTLRPLRHETGDTA